MQVKLLHLKLVVISKIVHLTLFKVKPISNILKLIKQRNILYWKSGNPDIKQDTLCKDYENGGLKDVDITFNILSLQCSWVKSLDDSSTQELGKENIFYFTLTYS